MRTSLRETVPGGVGHMEVSGPACRRSAEPCLLVRQSPPVFPRPRPSHNGADHVAGADEPGYA